MNPERLLNTFFELVKIDSPCRSEAAVAAYCEAELKRLGFTVRYDNSRTQTGSDTDNLIAFLPGTLPGHIALSAHMDCVDPCRGVEPIIKDGTIYSAGDTILSADDKAGIAAIFEAVESALEQGSPRPDITVLLTVCEELSLLGAAALPDDLFEGDVPCFVFDANGAPGTVVVGSPCHFRIQASFTGKAAHAGVEPEAGISAIQIAADAIQNMPLGRLDEHSTANIGLISGGHEVNIVPEHCMIAGECRSLFDDRAITQKDIMISACEAAAKKHGGEVNIEWELDYPSLLHKEGDPLIAKLKQATQLAGLEFKMINTGGGADANVLGLKGANPVTLSIGMTSFHSTEEYITVEHLNQTADLAEAIIEVFSK